MSASKRVSKLSGDQKKDLFWNSIMSQSLSDLRGALTSTGIEAHTRHEETGRTSIMEAALKGKVKSLDCLLDWYERRRELRAKGWMDLKDDEGSRTALMLASGEGHLECVKSLVRYGANIHSKDEEGKTARDLAFARKKTAVVEFIDETLRPPSEDEVVEEGPDGQVMTSTQRSKLKKKGLKAAEGVKQDAAPTTSAGSLQRGDRDKSLEPQWDEVAKLCESFDMLRTIHEVNVAKADASTVDPALWSCHWLKLVRLRLGPDFTSLPGTELAKLSELQQLILSGNPNLTALPQEVGSLTRLRVLELEGCGLTSLPSSIGQLSGLESLNVSNNKLKDLGLDGCNSLGLLNVSGNMLAKLALPYARMTRLSEVRCSRNQIDVLDPELGLLSNLMIFEAEFNKIRELPIELTQLKKIKVFKLEGNPIADPKLAKLVKEGKGPKDLFNKLEKVEERSSSKSKKGAGKKQVSKATEQQKEEEEEEGESSDLDLDDDDI